MPPMAPTITAVVSVSQNGPKVEPLYCSRTSSQPNVTASRHRPHASTISSHAKYRRDFLTPRADGGVCPAGGMTDGSEKSGFIVCSGEDAVAIMLSRLSDQASACNSRFPFWTVSMHDVLHGRSCRYKPLDKILSTYSQEDFRDSRCSSSSRQGGYNP